MKQFSIVAHTTLEVSIVNPEAFLEPGCNVFTVMTRDIEEVRRRLEDLGVKVLSINPIEQPPTTLDDLLLVGDRGPDHERLGT
jgi:hypothetical protein